MNRNGKTSNHLRLEGSLGDGGYKEGEKDNSSSKSSEGNSKILNIKDIKAESLLKFIQPHQDLYDRNEEKFIEMKFGSQNELSLKDFEELSQFLIEAKTKIQQQNYWEKTHKYRKIRGSLAFASIILSLSVAVFSYYKGENAVTQSREIASTFEKTMEKQLIVIERILSKEK